LAEKNPRRNVIQFKIGPPNLDIDAHPSRNASNSESCRRGVSGE